VEYQGRDADHHEYGDEDDDAVSDEAPGSPAWPAQPSVEPACLIAEKRYDLTVALPVASAVLLVVPAVVMTAPDVVATPEIVPAARSSAPEVTVHENPRSVSGPIPQLTGL
jgi:hypothetical protein